MAYLFGSGASKRNEMGPLSDLDFAVKFEDTIAKTEQRELHLTLLSDLISILGDKIDLVVMNDASLLFQFNVIKTGEILFKSGEKEKVELESKITQKNLDIKYYRERHADEHISKLAKRGFK